MTGGADVVVVADFEGASSPRFELHCFLFLAAWMTHHGASRAWPLHLACVGEPPQSVRRTADRVGAEVTVHRPLVINTKRTSNKLRGFEVIPRTSRLLLLDADTLVLKDLAPLADLVGDGIGVGVATVNHFPETTWRQIYQATGVAHPGPTGTCWCVEEALAAHRGLSPAQAAMCRRMPPYFHSGVVMVPWRLGLGARWRRHLEQIAPLFAGPEPLESWGRAGVGDEHALATTVEGLRQEGATVVPIPWAFHTRPLLLRTGVQPWTDVVVFHYHRALKPYAGSVRDLSSLFRRARAGRAAGNPIPARDLAAFGEFYTFLEELLQGTLRDVRG
ncbi:MAG: hypothetical protein RDU83_09520 [bacterium]|nr:hypothetical protein [bacterium]